MQAVWGAGVAAAGRREKMLRRNTPTKEKEETTPKLKLMEISPSPEVSLRYMLTRPRIGESMLEVMEALASLEERALKEHKGRKEMGEDKTAVLDGWIQKTAYFNSGPPWHGEKKLEWREEDFLQRIKEMVRLARRTDMSEGLKKERGQPVMLWNDVVKYLNHQISESLEEMGKEKRMMKLRKLRRECILEDLKEENIFSPKIIERGKAKKWKKELAERWRKETEISPMKFQNARKLRRKRNPSTESVTKEKNYKQQIQKLKEKVKRRRNMEREERNMEKVSENSQEEESPQKESDWRKEMVRGSHGITL